MTSVATNGGRPMTALGIFRLPIDCPTSPNTVSSLRADVLTAINIELRPALSGTRCVLQTCRRLLSKPSQQANGPR